MPILSPSADAHGHHQNISVLHSQIQLWTSKYLYLSFSNVCKATAVTHTNRIDRNLLRKETSFVYYTSSVLRKSRHLKQKKKLCTVATTKTQDYKNEDYKNLAQLQLLH